MRNLLNATLPALALLALGGCATSGALTSTTETDGVYYSSKDHTTAASSATGYGYGQPASSTSTSTGGYATAPATTTDAAAPDDANPDYQGGSTAATSGSDYYNNSYTSGSYNGSGFGQPYTGPGVSSYNYSPGWSVSPSFYGSPFGYGAGLGFGYGYSPFSYGYPGYGGFYDPFYSPFGYGYGSGLSLSFGYGFGGFGYPYGFGSPFGYGYSPFYGAYGRGYFNDYYGGYGRPIIYANGATSGPGANPILVGPRGGRGGTVMNGVRSIDPNAVNAGNGRRSNSTGTYAPSGNVVAAPNAAYTPGTAVAPTRRDGGGGGNIVGQPTYSTPGTTGQLNAPGQPQNATGRRGGFFSGFFGNGGGATSNANGNPAGANSGQMQQMQRRSSYSQQVQQNGGYQPQQRSYSQPQQPSYSQPQRSFGGGSYGGGGGGGSFGGGGGGGGGRRGGR